MKGERSNWFSRRQMLRQILGMGLSLPLAGILTPWSVRAQGSPAQPAMPTLSPEDDKFLDEVENACFLYFWD
jgi:hypothetical protein